MSRALAVAVLTILPYYVSAQAPACLSGFQSLFNSLNQTPCDVASALGGVCTGTTFLLEPLAPGFVYVGPTVANATPCRCSSVYYSLLSACAVCQGHNFTSWTVYNTNCTQVYEQVFPQPIPASVSIPHYAYLDVQDTNEFNVTAAETIGGTDSTAIPQSTSTSTSASATSTSTSAGKSNKSNVGLIAGGVSGGVVVLALLGGLIAVILRRRKRPAPSTFTYDSVVIPEAATMAYGNGNYNPSIPTSSIAPAMVPGKIYDPNDPSTFPTHDPGYSAYSSSPDINQQRAPITPTFTGTGSIVTVPRSTTHYTGAPEL